MKEAKHYDLGELPPESSAAQALEFINENRDRMIRFAHVRGAGWLAEEAVQDAMTNLYRRRDDLHAQNISGLATVTVLNKARDFARMNRRCGIPVSLEDPEYHFAGEENLEDRVIEKLQLEEVQETIASLLPIHQEVILLASEGYTQSEMAELLNVNQGTIKSRLSRGRDELKRRLATQSSTS
jgi:RNA polymerase sigma-70 factor (ECF subfamily)